MNVDIDRHLAFFDGESDALTIAEAEEYLAGVSFRPTVPPTVPRKVGVELEHLVYESGDRTLPVHPDRTRQALHGWTPHGQWSFEAGGQLELSSAPGALEECIEQCRSDLARLRDELTRAGLCLGESGLDPIRPPRRQSALPRYAALEEAFDRDGEAGRWMLFSTVSVQVCLDAGGDGHTAGLQKRWELANAIAPVLTAAFANSPIQLSRPTGWRSTRQAKWLEIDRSRTSRPAPAADPREAWARYALDAKVACIVNPAGQPWTVPRNLTFREWVTGGRPRPPSIADLKYHLTTLFPPVRPKGYLELRMIDAQRGDNWMVPLAVATALLDDPAAAQAAMAAVERLHTRLDEPYVTAARDGLSNPLVAEAARECFAAAYLALPRVGASARTVDIVAGYIESYTDRGRSPADDDVP